MIVKELKELRKIVKENKASGKKVGLVPTMGYLHQGHLSLIKKAKSENDLVVVSVFVNPIQFGPNEDFESYPRDIDRDRQLAESAGADIVFNPEVEEVFPTPLKTKVEVEGLTQPLCGRNRPTHFQGVTTIVSKLFNMVAPDNAYFGQKDAQQFAVINKMVDDLNFDINMNMCPIIREEDGLAMSSRNVYLSEEERKQALIISKSLFAAEKMIAEGERSAARIKKSIIELINTQDLTKIDYVEIHDFKELEEIEEIEGQILIAAAVKLGKTRLIDNIILEVN